MMTRRRFLLLAMLLFEVYLGSYLRLSRHGYAEADQYNMHGFYYFFPENTEAWRKKHRACVLLYAPLNFIDRALGTGRAPASEPLWGLSR
ncbi:MAG: hypothetical protein L0241_27815 [Planctomycetia bacterium]|nr:hypothetical protein [Planctomycetia bacterium]